MGPAELNQTVAAIPAARLGSLPEPFDADFHSDYFAPDFSVTISNRSKIGSLYFHAHIKTVL